MKLFFRTEPMRETGCKLSLLFFWERKGNKGLHYSETLDTIVEKEDEENECEEA